ncbi:MAG: hypothetical protein ACKVOE_04635 [Rickettsiales bacterium]
MTQSWLNKIQNAVPKGERSIDDLTTDFLAVLSSEFGMELNADDISLPDEELEAEWDDELGKIRHAVRDYVKDWLLDNLSRKNGKQLVVCNESRESIDTLATELLGLKEDIRNNSSLSQQANATLAISDDTTVDGMVERLKRVLKPLQEQIMQGIDQAASTEVHSPA